MDQQENQNQIQDRVPVIDQESQALNLQGPNHDLLIKEHHITFTQKVIFFVGIICSVVLVVLYIYVSNQAKINYELISLKAQETQDQIMTLRKERESRKLKSTPSQFYGSGIFKSEEFGFEFSYLEKSTESLSGNSLRIQNFVSGHGKNYLDPGEYYIDLELLLLDKSCISQIIEPEQIFENGFIKYMGKAKEQSLDFGGPRFAMCLERNNEFLFVQITDGDSNGSISRQIFSNFKSIE